MAKAYELPPHLLQFGMDHADWDVDDIIFVVFMFSTVMMIYGFRRYQDLSREIKARIGAELEARNLARHDPLTGLPNRRFFKEKLEECLAPPARRIRWPFSCSTLMALRRSMTLMVTPSETKR